MNVVDLFCGCGGLSLGFQKAGFNIIAAYDNWDAALNVYNQNFNHSANKIDLSDITVCCREIEQLKPEKRKRFFLIGKLREMENFMQPTDFENWPSERRMAYYASESSSTYSINKKNRKKR